MAAECCNCSKAGRGSGPEAKSERVKASRVVLIGYRCSGKTSVGQVLATRLGWRCVDTDAEIERAAGRPITQIVAEEGWPGFRRREREAVRTLSGERALVIAAGGGAVMDEANRAELQRDSLVVYLACDPQTIAGRMEADARTASQRPGLTGRGALAEVSAVLAEREPVYEAAADYRIETAGRGIGEIAAEIGRLIDEEHN